MKKKVLNFLINSQDLGYLKFTKKITVTNYEIIGVRIPVLRRYAKDLDISYIGNTYNKYYEEVFLEGVIISKEKKIENLFDYLDYYVPKIDCWSLCDYFVSSLIITKKYPLEMWNYLKKYLSSSNEFEIRFVIVMYLNYYLNNSFIDEVLLFVSKVESNMYYVNMALSWLVATSFIVDREKTLQLLTSNVLSNWVQNKAISKIRDSYKVSVDDKKLLLNYKR